MFSPNPLQFCLSFINQLPLLEFLLPKDLFVHYFLIPFLFFSDFMVVDCLFVKLLSLSSLFFKLMIIVLTIVSVRLVVILGFLAHDLQRHILICLPYVINLCPFPSLLLCMKLIVVLNNGMGTCQISFNLWF